MNAIQRIKEIGQSLWMDGITCGMLKSGTLRQFFDENSITGLTFSLDAFGLAIKKGSAYDETIFKMLKNDKLGEELLLDLAMEDLCYAADLLRPVYDQTEGVDGWVSMCVSPLQLHDAVGMLSAVRNLHASARRPNILIEIPGTKHLLPVVEDAIFTGVPVNVTLLFSPEQYLAVAGAFQRGIERRIAAGLRANIASVASVSINLWDVAVMDKVPATLKNKLGIAMGGLIYKTFCETLNSAAWERIFNAGGRPQRLLWTGMSCHDPAASAALYFTSLVAPFTVKSLEEKTFRAITGHEQIGSLMRKDGEDCLELLARFGRNGIDLDELAQGLQDECTSTIIAGWIDLMGAIASKCAVIAHAFSEANAHRI